MTESLMTKKEYHEQVRPTEDWFVLQRIAEGHEIMRNRVLRRKPNIQPWMISAMTRKGLL